MKIMLIYLATTTKSWKMNKNDLRRNDFHNFASIVTNSDKSDNLN